MMCSMNDAQSPTIGPVSRRSALKAFGTGLGAAAALPWLSDEGLLAFATIQETNAPPRPKVLSAAQYHTLETLAEAIIPADTRSAGAKDARVADYIDLWLSEADRPIVLLWLGGLALVDAEASSRFKLPFARLNANQIDAILTTMSRNEKEPETPLEEFFVMAKQATVNGYYTSKIGIDNELRYKGNVFLKEFVGCQTEDGKDCPICGQKHG
jgi:hypothetical protein